MKSVWLIVSLLLIMSLCAGCTSKYHNPDITVSSADIDGITPATVGSFDVYTASFRVENPTNMSFKNVEVRINIVPLLSYCHPLSKTIEIPVLFPAERITIPFSIAEFNDLDCQYSYTFSAVSENIR